MCKCLEGGISLGAQQELNKPGWDTQGLNSTGEVREGNGLGHAGPSRPWPEIRILFRCNEEFLS